MKNFLNTLYQPSVELAAYLVLWSKTEMRSFLLSELDKAVTYAEEAGRNSNIYFAPGLQAKRPAGRARGEARTVLAIPALWLDLDVAGGAHAKVDLPSREQALALLDEAPWQPSIVLETGGGFHCYWQLVEPCVMYSPEDNAAVGALMENFQRYFIEHGRMKGFHVDKTSSLNQLLRLPGTLSHKYSPPFHVAVIRDDVSCRYTLDQFSDLITSSNTTAVEVSPSPASYAYSSSASPENTGAVDLELIEKDCSFMAHCRENSAFLSEPEWFAQATIISRCENGESLFHERSSSHPHYNQQEAQGKLENARKYGPRTCESIALDLGFLGCENCEFKSHVRSPIRLGDMSPVAMAKIVTARMLVEAKNDPGAPFTEESLESLTLLSSECQPLYMRTRDALKQLGIPIKKLEDALKAQAKSSNAGPGYGVTANCMMMEKMTNAGTVSVPLSNFSVEIIEEVTCDDGAEKTKQFTLNGVHASGKPLPQIKVNVQEFISLNWVLEKYGSVAVILAGCRDHFRTAVQLLSTNVTARDQFLHTGWRLINGEWAYLNGKGAIGKDGLMPNVEVDLGEGGLKDFQLELPEPDEIPMAIAAALQILDLAPLEISAPLFAGVFLAPLGVALTIDFSLFLAGFTGTRKSEMAAIAQGFFGSEFRGKNLPANWTSTENSLEKQCFLAKDTITVVDDFNPVGSLTDINVFHKKADRLLRGQGNQAGRQRMRSGGTLRPTYYPRGLILATGEETPKGQSLRARMLVLEVQPVDVNCNILTKLQESRDNGLLVKTMAAYVQWIAPKVEELSSSLPERKKALKMDSLEAGKAHTRTPDIVASLMIGVEMFSQFALEKGVITQEQAEKLWQDCQAAIFEAAKRQSEIQEEESPCQRFLDLLGAILTSGAAHFEDFNGGVPRATPEAYGWHEVVTGMGTNQTREHRPLGKLAGWVDDKSIYLDPDVAFGAVQALASSQGSPITLGLKTLQKRLANKGLIESADPGNNTKRMTIAGVRRRILHISRNSVHQQKPDAFAFAASSPAAAFSGSGILL
ncbi:MAG: hypothetical protein AAGU21_15660 [Solidesulfovibrio sp.]|uniref:hypothetical protein n=1 Tax=Solidesulfovibrio sp. TaxID=2910990 RepID=UPI0031582CE9